MGTATKTLCFGITTVAIAYLYLRWNPEGESHLNAIEKQMIDVWSKEIRYPEKTFNRLAVGTNANVDVIVPGVKLLQQLNVAPGNKQNHNQLTNLHSLQETFSYFFSKGRAAERIFTKPDVFKTVVKAAFDLGNIEQYIGGNAALMAKKASSLFPNVKIQFVGPVGPIVHKLMPANISIPASSLVEQDEFHLIMEYKVGEKWGSSQAPVATRFICSYDASNSEMSMLDTFFASLPDFSPDLVLLSGLHMLDGQESDFFHARLDVLVKGLKRVQPQIPVHLEFASMANAHFMKSIIEKVLPQITSLGLNEQELGFASIAMKGPHSDHLDSWEGQPLIHVMSDIIHWLLSTFGKSSQRPDSRLTRIHFHSLTYHIVAVHRSQWSNVKSATMAGTRIAGLQACDISTLDPDLLDLRIPLTFQLYSGDEQHKFDAARPASTWSRGEFDFVFSPVLVCKHPVKTVGLGDAISATGLMFSHFSL